jgi:ADP-ribose pyrophosphatase YjhB (NUDIX family)
MNRRLPTAEEDFLKTYDARKYDRPSTSVDAVIFTVFDQTLQVLTVKRAEYPYKGKWSLVGGFVNPESDKNLEDTAKRKLFEKTGVKTPYLEQCFTIGNSKRDPRGWSITTVYFALLPYEEISLEAASGASDTRWQPIHNVEIETSLAFDHNELLRLTIERLRSKVLYTTLPAYLMPKTFTLGDLQRIFEIILNRKLEVKSFRRRIATANVLEAVDQMRQNVTRPAQLYRLREDIDTHYFLRSLEG